MLGEFFNGGDQVGMFFAQWLKLVEQWIDHQGSDDDESEKDQDGGKPEIQPPAPRTAPHYGKQDQDQNDSKRRAQTLSLGPIPEPRAPALNGLFVMQGKRMPIRVHRQVQNVEGQEKKRHENQRLNPFLVANTFRDVAKLCRPTEPENQKKEIGRASSRE